MKIENHIASDASRSARLQVIVPPAYKAAIDRAAKAHHTTMADFVKAALNKALANEPTTGIDPDFELLTTRIRPGRPLDPVLGDLYDRGFLR
jgi:hypothetical protein